MNGTKPQKTGLLGRGPWFWLSLTAGCTAAVVGLKFSGAIEKSTTALLLMVVPLGTFLAMLASLLRVNESGSGNCVQRGEAQRRYIKRVAVFTSLYLATFAALTFLDQLGEAPLAARFIVAAMPGIAIIGVFWAIGRLIVEEGDEFIRMLTIRQTLVASALAMSAASVWGFLESAELVAHVDAYWYAVVWFGGLFVGALANRIEYGTWGAA